MLTKRFTYYMFFADNGSPTLLNSFNQDKKFDANRLMFTFDI